MVLAWVCYYDALLAVGLVAAGIVAAHFELIAPFYGFQMMIAGLAFAALGLVCALFAVPITAFSAKRKAARGRALVGAVLALAILVPVVVVIMQTRSYPLINDITTDPDHPPVFVKALELQPGRNMSYNPDLVAVQKGTPAYADLAPLKMAGSLDEVFAKMAILAGRIPSWVITRNDPQVHSLEGIATSGLFRFHDDFIIEVRPADGGGSLVEMRSKSRDGKGDLGANYHRIMSFLALVKTGPQNPAPGSAQVQP